MSTLSPIQQLILQAFVIEPEDQRAFELAQRRANRAANPEKFCAQARELYRRNPEKSRVRSRAWHKKNPERAAWLARNWEAQNPERWRKNTRRRHLERLQEPNYHLRCALRTRVRMALKQNIKSGHTLELLGCTIPEWRAHLEALFRPGMTWENCGSVWHVDHKKPCVAFDLTNPAQQRACFHFSNTQPLFVSENCSKGGAYE